MFEDTTNRDREPGPTVGEDRAWRPATPVRSGAPYRESPPRSLRGSETWVLPLRRKEGPVGVERDSRPSLVERLKDRKFVQWLVAYIAMAWIGLQFTQTLAEIWDLPISIQRGISVTLALGLLPALVVAWYHGEMGRQRVCGTEACVLGVLTVGAAITVWQTCFA